MGLLDEAIREHLELKRRRGADPEEIAKVERDALGPARRGPEPLEVPEASASEPPVDTLPDDREPEPDGPPVAREPEEPVASFEPLDEPFAPDDEPGGAVAMAPADEPPTQIAQAPDDQVWADDAEIVGQETIAFDPLADREPEPPEPDPEPEPLDPGASTAEPEPEPERGGAVAMPDPPPPASEGDGDDDVLEETPDFLQETPEHDRLWFEQRPPRDFDFDG